MWVHSRVLYNKHGYDETFRGFSEKAYSCACINLLEDKAHVVDLANDLFSPLQLLYLFQPEAICSHMKTNVYYLHQFSMD